MRLLLIIMGALAVSSASKNPRRRKTVGGALITIWARWAAGIAGSQHCNNAWPTCAGLAETVRPVRTRPRQDDINRVGIERAILTEGLRLALKLRQFGDICRNLPRPVGPQEQGEVRNQNPSHERRQTQP
jgi:hypothetical protein